MTPWLWLSLALAAFCLLAGAYIFFTACARRKEYSWLDAEALRGTPYEKHIDLIAHSDAWLKAHDARDIYVTSEDGLKLHGYFIPARDPKGTILLAHGYRSTMLVDFGMVLEVYHELGLNLLLPEQRAHGSSEGRYITFGVKESRDMLCWLRYHNENLSACPVVLSGLSMGASTVMYMLDEALPSNVKAVICDCGFTSPAEIIGVIFKRVMHFPGGFFVRIADLYARVFAGFSLYGKDSRKTLAQNKWPILLVHGTADDFVPCEMTRQGYAACTGEKHLILAEGAAHGYSFLIARQKYEQTIKSLIDRL